MYSGIVDCFFFLMIRRPPRSTLDRSSAASDVYKRQAAVAGQSVVKLYAAAMIPGFFLAFLYLRYVIGWAVLKPSVAPRLPPEQERAPITPWVGHVSGQYGSRMLPALLAAVAAPRRGDRRE